MRPVREGFAGFATTLLISPYQNHDLIAQVGQKAAADHGVEFVHRFPTRIQRGADKGKGARSTGNPIVSAYSEKERYHRAKNREVQE